MAETHLPRRHRSRSEIPAAVVLALCWAVCWGCASGGGGRGRRTGDAGGSPDTGTPAVDGGGTVDAGGGLDGGSPPRDSGPILRMDSGPGGPDGGPMGCTSAAGCADGLACNGVERCVGGRCEPGTAMVCDDGIACTTNGCVEPGSCNFAPDDSLCAAGQTCSAATGCVSGCAETPCRLVAPQCGCPSGQGCYVDGSATRLCATAGTASEGQSCTGTSGCRAGNLCINISSGPASNICSRFCNADFECASGALCLITLGDGSGGTLPGVTLCTHACDPVRQTGCPAGAGCDIFQESAGAMRTFADCAAPVGTRVQGQSCAAASDCAGGYACIDPDGPGGTPQQCMHWCLVASGFGCGGGTTCTGFSTAVRVGGIEYGVCL